MRPCCLLEDSNGFIYIGFTNFENKESVLVILDDTLKQVNKHSLDGIISFLSISYKDKSYIV